MLVWALAEPSEQAMNDPDSQVQTDLEAAVLRALLKHLQKRSDVQNIGLMNLAGFCRNCLSRWYVEAAANRGMDISMDAARKFVYGMDYDQWKSHHQTEASPEQKAAFQKVMADPGLTS